MTFDDPLLPAATYLTGVDATDVITPAIAAAGGRLATLRPNQVIYRPGHELVVSFAATVAWGGRDPIAETLLAATTSTGEPAGTVPVEADNLRVGVWRYPFDPSLPGLADAVVPGPVAALLGVPAGDLRLEVRTFRPCRRAVVHATWPGGEAYVKVVRPAEAADLVDRHRRLATGGVRVPEVVAVDERRGLVALEALGGIDLRTRLLNGGPLPTADDLLSVTRRFAAVDLPAGQDGCVSLLAAAPRHAAMLARVLPGAKPRIEALIEALGQAEADPRTFATVHGDLHEAQLRVGDDGAIVGVLDVDDAGPGDPVDDLARLLGHLTALAILSPRGRERTSAYVRRLRSGLVGTVDGARLDRRVSAALVGLATGPFRTQATDWPRLVGEVLDAANHWLADERTLSTAS
ncbi:MAG: aminoglycoside phosphotransferase family protein [Acidimicrobiia bacterium]